MIMIASWNNNNCMEIIRFSIERTSSSFVLSASYVDGHGTVEDPRFMGAN